MTDSIVISDKDDCEAEFTMAEFAEFIADVKSGKVEAALADTRKPRYKGDIS